MKNVQTSVLYERLSKATAYLERLDEDVLLAAILPRAKPSRRGSYGANCSTWNCRSSTRRSSAARKLRTVVSLMGKR